MNPLLLLILLYNYKIEKHTGKYDIFPLFFIIFKKYYFYFFFFLDISDFLLTFFNLISKILLVLIQKKILTATKFHLSCSNNLTQTN